MVFFFRGSWCHTDEPCSLLAVTDAIINGASSSEIITFYSASLCLLNSITLQSSPNRHVSKPSYYWQSICSVILIPCNSWLLLLRIRALPAQFIPRPALLICSSLWVSTFTSCIILYAIKMSSTPYPGSDDLCMFTMDFHPKALSIPFISLVLFDSVAVYITLIGLLSATSERKWYESIKSLISTEYMGHTSRIFLRTGQAYYV